MQSTSQILLEASPISSDVQHSFRLMNALRRMILGESHSVGSLVRNAVLQFEVDGGVQGFASESSHWQE
jgi:hypothetical protein